MKELSLNIRRAAADSEHKENPQHLQEVVLQNLMYQLDIEELHSFCCCKVCVCQKLVESHKIGHDSVQCKEFSSRLRKILAFRLSMCCLQGFVQMRHISDFHKSLWQFLLIKVPSKKKKSNVVPWRQAWCLSFPFSTVFHPHKFSLLIYQPACFFFFFPFEMRCLAKFLPETRESGSRGLST